MTDRISSFFDSATLLHRAGIASILWSRSALVPTNPEYPTLYDWFERDVHLLVSDNKIDAAVEAITASSDYHSYPPQIARLGDLPNGSHPDIQVNHDPMTIRSFPSSVALKCSNPTQEKPLFILLTPISVYDIEIHTVKTFHPFDDAQHILVPTLHQLFDGLLHACFTPNDNDNGRHIYAFHIIDMVSESLFGHHPGFEEGWKEKEDLPRDMYDFAQGLSLRHRSRYLELFLLEPAELPDSPSLPPSLLAPSHSSKSNESLSSDGSIASSVNSISTSSSDHDLCLLSGIHGVSGMLHHSCSFVMLNAFFRTALLTGI